MSVERRMSMSRRISFANDNCAFDSVMEKVGTGGTFQKKFNIIFNFLLVIATSMPYLNIILILAIPDHWCYVPGRENTNFTLEEWRNLTVPMDMDTRGRPTVSKCTMYNITLDSYDSLASRNITEDPDVIECQYGWEYDRTWYTETAASQEDWVCEKELFVSNAFAFGRIGDVVGTFTFGQLGDIVGRRPVFYITLITLVVGRCLSAFTAHNFHLFLFATLLGSLTSTAVFQAPLIVAMEISEESHRAHIAMLQCLGWTAGMCLLPFFFWALGHWFEFMLTTTIPCVLFFFSYKLMIESPRWLASQGKTAKCIRQLELIAKINGTKVPKDAWITLKKRGGKSDRGYGVMSLFSSWRLAKNTLMLIICWINGALTYYVIVLNVNSLGGNPFLNFLAQGLAELPAYVLGRISSDRIGRRLSQVFAFFTAGITCIPVVFLISDTSKGFVISALATFIKFAVSFVFYATNLQTLEIYPTCVRQSGLAFGAISASAFGILGPYIVYLGTAYDARYPYMILTGLMFLGCICATFLPETLHQKLPETLADAQVFGADQKYFVFPKKQEKPDVLLKK